MKQHPLDLMPETLRHRAEAGMVAGRYAFAVIIAVFILVVLGSHARLRLSRIDKQLRDAESKAAIAEDVERRAEQLQQEQKQTQQSIDVYRQLAHPLDVSSVIASVVNVLPESMTVDRIDIEAGERRKSRRGKSSNAPIERLLTGEISGFAATDRDIAELLHTLDELPPFDNVTLDYTRTHPVRDISAREFRLSFEIDLREMYVVHDIGQASLLTEVGSNVY